MKARSFANVTLALFLCFFAGSVLAKAETTEQDFSSIQTKKTGQSGKLVPNQQPPKTTFSSVEERRLYTILQNERDSLEEEKKVLALREKELKTLEEEADKKLKLIDDKLDELMKVQKKIASLLVEKDVEEQKKIQDLGMIYAKMSPERAALALGTLDEQLAADLLANMKVKSAAKILDRMDKAKASQLSTTFTTIKVE